MENESCIWIGVGTDIPKESALYHTVKDANGLLVKKYNGKDGFAGSECPHLNLYDLSVPKENVNSIIEKIKEIAKEQRSFTVKTGKVNYFPFGLFFLEIEESQDLLNLHKKIVEQIVTLNGGCIDKDYLAPHRKYTQKQRDTLMKYGNPYVLDQFQPHITVGFVRNHENKLAEICKELNSLVQSQEFHVNTVHIVAGEGKEKTMVYTLKHEQCA